MKISFSSLCFFVVLLISSQNLLGQSDTAKPAGHFKIEVEPTAFIGHGYSVLASYSLLPNKNLSIGLYTFNIALPTKMNKTIFNNVADSTDIHLNFELALSARYKFAMLDRASGPYVGMFLGYETFQFTHPSKTTLNTSNMFFTPQVGYEFYYFRKLLYINPCLRTVFEFSKKSDDATRTEEIKSFIFLPSVSLGVRF